MKISKIIIPAYRQFKNFELDLTYPEGHPKAGQPLDKVCLIGQSGTGKTTLLNIVRGVRDEAYKINDIETSIQAVVPFEMGEQKLYLNITLRKSGNKVEYEDYLTNNGDLNLNSIAKNSASLLKSYTLKKNKLIHFPAEIIDNFNQILQKEKTENILDSIKTVEEIDIYLTKKEEKLAGKNIFDFSKDNVLDIWSFILRKNEFFWNEELKWKNKIADAVVKDFASSEELITAYKEWKANTPNPIENIANQLNIILNHFQLEIVKEFEYTRIEDLYFIKVQTLNGQKVPFTAWSTGTKQILLNALPLINIDTTDGMVLMDEPERSLYPDIQRKIVDFYTGIAPKAQFFIATHSPIIAASFEPWEIIELVFDDNGFVQPRKYYEGNRHIDNYFIDFRYLRWDDILMKGFGMDEEGNSFFREREMTKAARLRKRLDKMRVEGKTQTIDYETSLNEYLVSAKKIGWTNEKN